MSESDWVTWLLLSCVVLALAGLPSFRRSRASHGRSLPVPRTDVDLRTAQHVLIVSASIAAGHDGAADELARRCADHGAVVDRSDFLDLLPLGLGGLLRSLYRAQLEAVPGTWGWLLRRLEHPRSLRLVGGIFAGLARRRLLGVIGADTQLIIATYPLASHALGALRQRGLVTASVQTFLTDMSVHPLWVAPGVDTHLALHEVPARQARLRGAQDVHVVGPALSAAFRPALPGERTAARERLTLPADAHLALVVAGSWGVGDILRTVEDVNLTGLATPVVVCGKNQRLYAALVAEGTRAFGWVQDMATLMRACDTVIQNAGGLTCLEARASGLPLITYRALPGHGRTNADALEEAGWASWAHSTDQLAVFLSGHLSTTSPPTDRLLDGLIHRTPAGTA